MPTVDIDQWSFDKIDFIRRVTGLSHAATVRSILERLDGDESHTAPDTPPPSTTPPSEQAPLQNEGTVKVFSEYKGHRIEGLFTMSTKSLRITTAPLAGRHFDSPTAAAVAVVKANTPDREKPETNGRKFWRLDETGKELRSILGQRF